jgi:small subunit ribosomal protein S9
MAKNNTVTKIHGVGRRKASVARVWMSPGEGEILVNGKVYSEYFTTDASRAAVTFPLEKTNLTKNFDIEVNVVGGGVTGQAGAVGLGISRALLISDEALRLTLREHGLLTVDSRVKERKKYGQKGARRKFQFVKR